MSEGQNLKESTFEGQTLKKSSIDDKNLSQSKCKDQDDLDGFLSSFESTMSYEDLSSIFFIESAGIQLLIHFGAKSFQTSLHQP